MSAAAVRDAVWHAVRAMTSPDPTTSGYGVEAWAHLHSTRVARLDLLARDLRYIVRASDRAEQCDPRSRSDRTTCARRVLAHLADACDVAEADPTAAMASLQLAARALATYRELGGAP